MIDLPLGMTSLPKVTLFCKVLQLFKNWAKLHRKFDKKKKKSKTSLSWTSLRLPNLARKEPKE
jgi:hypothetical protein